MSLNYTRLSRVIELLSVLQFCFTDVKVDADENKYIFWGRLIKLAAFKDAFATSLTKLLKKCGFLSFIDNMGFTF